MTEIRLELKDPRAVAALLREMLPINADDFNPEERPTIESICSQIEEQVKPAIEEPVAFGSVVRARWPGLPKGTEHPLWHLAPLYGRHYWMSEAGVVEVWSELTDVEVLRVGLGERPDVEPEFTEDYKAGASDVVHQLHEHVSDMLDDAITSERKNAYEKVLQAVEGLKW